MNFSNEFIDSYGRVILGYCGYCKNPVYDYEDFSYIKGTIYHKECEEQSKTYVDDELIDEEEGY